MNLVWILLIIFVVAFGLVVFRGAPYVPSQKKYIKNAFTELYPLNSSDVLVDMGSGDGVVLRQAAKFGARAIGYEINPFLVLVTRFLSRRNDLIEVKLADFWLSHLPDDVTIIYVFAVTRDVKKMSQWVQKETNRLGRDIYLMSYGNEFKSLSLVKKLEAYNLYVFHPLQPDKA